MSCRTKVRIRVDLERRLEDALFGAVSTLRRRNLLANELLIVIDLCSQRENRCML